MAQCTVCEKEVSAFLYVAMVPREEIYKAEREGGMPAATHVGIRLREELLANYRSPRGSGNKSFLEALAGDTSELEAWRRKLEHPRKDGSVQGRVSVIEAKRVDAVKEDVDRKIDERHDYALVSNHCRGHDFDDVVKVVEAGKLPLELRWNAGPVQPLLRSDIGRAGMRCVMVRNKSEARSLLAELLEAN